MAFFTHQDPRARSGQLPFGAQARAEAETDEKSSTKSGGGASNEMTPEMEAALKTRIIAQPSATNLNVCRFMVDAVIREGSLIRISSADKAEDSPLAKRLFEIPRVVSTAFVGNVVTVTKEGDTPWQEVARQIGTAIRLHLASGQPALTREPEPSVDGAVSDDELFQRVQDVIDTLINPGVAGHGGFVRLLGVEKDTAYVQLGGGCHGCGMAALTLKEGVAEAIQKHVPEIQHVLDATDHSSGQNPYYASQD